MAIACAAQGRVDRNSLALYGLQRMRSRGAIGRFVAVGLLPALLLTGAVPGWTLFHCTMSDEAFARPCCPEAEAAQELVEGTTIGPGQCCLRIDATLDRADWVPHSPQLAALPALVETPITLPALSDANGLALDARAVMDTGPPIRLRIHSFQI